ncbi:MAG: hypothetical protein D6681_00660 [Calditrichaeota bacterium]|nr:MAG: hypothetical protein D6681_00660 [Calditrichota bacterium]
MMRRSFLGIALSILLVSTIQASPSPPPDSTELRKLTAYAAQLEFQVALVDYVYDLYLRYGEERIPEERFLITLMNLVNQELSRRLKNPREARQKYFRELHNMLVELQEFKKRLHADNIHELDTFVSDLEDRIAYTIDQEEIDFRKKKVFEDALQVLYVSEEMIRLDRERSPGQVSRRIGKSKEELMAAFGELMEDSLQTSGRTYTIYDLFVEWRKTNEAQFERRLADVLVVRRNLLKASGVEEILRMFNDELYVAYSRFNLGDYDLAERLLSDLINIYPEWGIKNLDDVYFYRAECNFALSRFLHARRYFEELIQQFPGTAYLPQIYSRLVQICYAQGEYDRVVEYAQLYQNVAAPTAEEYYDIQFLMAMAYYSLGNYDQAVDALSNIPETHQYYALAQYFMGNAYTGSGQYDEAARVYLGLIDQKSTPQDIHSRALYKMGILEYQRNNYQVAINYLSRIPRGFPRYDKVLNALAWAHFEAARSAAAVGGAADFSLAKLYARELIEQYYASPYKMEANSLLAYISQLEEDPLEAIQRYREVYETKEKRKDFEEYALERERLQQLYEQAVAMRNRAIQEKNTAAYAKANRLIAGLEARLSEIKLSEASSTGSAVFQEINSLIYQIKELNRLRLLAEEAGKTGAIARIDSLQLRLVAVLETFPAEVVERARYVNLFDEYPVSKYVVEENLRHDQLMQEQQEALDEIARIEAMQQEIERQVSMARVKRNFRLVGLLEQKYAYLEDLKKRYDTLLAAMYETPTRANPYPEFNKWGDLGGFGIINVYFDQKQKQEQQLTRLSAVLERVNGQLNRRKQVIEDQIKKIEAEIRFMTMKARMEERARLRAERERAFRESYFDTRESEIPEEEQ